MDYFRHYFGLQPRRPPRVLGVNPRQFLIRAIDNFGVKEVDDAGFKRLVNQVVREYSRQELEDMINGFEITRNVRPNATSKTIARIIVMLMLKATMEEFSDRDDFPHFAWESENEN